MRRIIRTAVLICRGGGGTGRYADDALEKERLPDGSGGMIRQCAARNFGCAISVMYRFCTSLSAGIAPSS